MPGIPREEGSDFERMKVRLGTALRDAVAECARSASSATVLYSGGLDSSLVAFLLKPVLPVRLLVIGTEDAKDPVAARAGAALLGLPLTEVTIDVASVADVRARFGVELEGLAEPLRSVNLALAIGLAHANGPRVVVGQGADELFYGYAHFRGLPSVAARERARIDWEMLVAHEWPRAERMARSIGLELRSPFLDSRVVELARESDPPAADEPPKIALRRTAALLGLPALLVDAPKRALQYGSGVHRLARRMDGTRGSRRAT